MAKLYSVKKICEETGLDRRALFEYEDIVAPVPERKNSGYETDRNKDHVLKSYKGYKQYDESSILKFRQINIYRKIGMKPQEIKEKFKNYDSKRILDEQIELLKEKKQEIENMITLAEQLKLIGMKNNIMMEVVAKVDISEYIYYTNKFLDSDIYKEIKNIDDDKLGAFADELFMLLNSLRRGAAFNPDDSYSYDIAFRFHEMCIDLFGLFGNIYIIALFFSVDGGGELERLISGEVDIEQINSMKLAMQSFAKKRVEEFFCDLSDIIDKYEECIGLEFTDSRAAAMAEDIAALVKQYIGLRKKIELDYVLENLPVYKYIEESIELQYCLKVLIWSLENKPVDV